jgi:hypothetical protein
MLGAVLHKVPDLKLVQWRLMKLSYGLIADPIFVEGKHPEHLKYRDKVDGNIRCRDVMRWCAIKVLSWVWTGD